MAWPTFFAIVQVIGCPAADADRVGALIDLEMAGSQVEAVEVRCGARVKVTAKAGARRASRALPGDALQSQGGARLVALAAADLADELAVAVPAEPAPAEAPGPTAQRIDLDPPPRWQLGGTLAGRTDFDEVRLATGLMGRWIHAGWLLELAGVYAPAQTTLGFINSESRLAQLALAAGLAFGPEDGLQTAGILGWAAGWGWLRGAIPHGAHLGGPPIGVTVDGPVGGPFLGARVLQRLGAGFASLSVDQGWTAWRLIGTVFGTQVDAFEGLWLSVAVQIGAEF